MTRWIVAAAAALSLLAVPARAQEKDVAGSKDHPLLTRMPGYYISAYEPKDFDSVDMSAYLSGDEAKWDGKTTRLTYEVKAGTKPISMVQIARNYGEAVKRAGGKILGDSGREVLGRFEKSGVKTWVYCSAHNEGSSYDLTIVEAKAMEQEVVADASALKSGLAAEGKVAVYGILFDTNKAVVKPESEPALVQITKLLQQDPKLQLFVVGHTDGVGTPEANQKLSADRAAAVVQALVSRGVSAARLKPSGVGMYSPVSTNRTEEGRARNRRVELVERI
jgi:outer membrane protein OmpA-like peptidoglycan-associated protein